MEIFTVYALKSELDGRIYLGFSSDVDKRLKQHNSGTTKSTKGFTPWKLIYTSQIEGSENARAKEI